jgi:nucleotide-binding universal stress UspA family protein
MHWVAARHATAEHDWGEDVTRLLVATDGSPSADVAVELVARTTWAEPTTVRIVEAIDTLPALFGTLWPTVAIMESDTIDAEIGAAAGETLARVRDRLTRPGVDVDAEVLRGRPATAIVDAADAFAADLIVMGSRGHGTIASMVLGSVSGEVVDHASVPVLVARRPRIARVVLAWDGSSCGRAAADIVRTWPVFRESSVRVVSVAEVEVPWWSGVVVDTAPDLVPALLDAAKALREEHDALARAMANDLRAAGLRADAELRAGDPATGILAAAQAIDADLIVLGTHGRTGPARLVLGSVARNVVRHATCSVLVAREPRVR